MLLDTKNREHFRNMTRHQIDAIAGGKTEEQRHNNQARMLAPLREVWYPNTFKLEHVARTT